MVTRIHYRRNGNEYVLQYDSDRDKVEFRINRYRLIGSIPNYFRDEWGTYVREIDAFKETLLDSKPSSRVTPLPLLLPEFANEEQVSLPELTDAEIKAIDDFEDIASITLLLTPKSVENSRKARLTAMREVAQLPGVDMTQSVNYAQVLSDCHRTALVWNIDPTEIESEPANEDQDHIEDEEGELTDEESQEIQAFVDTFAETIRLSRTQVPHRNIDEFINEIDETLDANSDDSVRGAPTRYLPDFILDQHSRQSRNEDDE